MSPTVRGPDRSTGPATVSTHSPGPNTDPVTVSSITVHSSDPDTGLDVASLRAAPVPVAVSMYPWQFVHLAITDIDRVSVSPTTLF